MTSSARRRAEGIAKRDGWPVEMIRSENDVAAVLDGCWYDAAAAEKVVLFFRKYLRHSKGRWAGQAFELLDWQNKKFLQPVFGWKRQDGSRRFRKAYVEVPKKNGKALSVDTAIPTPDGWSTMGAIRVGDRVFDECGSVCQVVAATEVMRGHRCYRVSFSDGTNVVADAGHLWRTRTRKPEGHHDVWTTEEIADSLRVEYVGSAGFNHSIVIERCLALPDRRLEVDPYVLGVWLGDGTSANSCVTVSYADTELVSHIQAAGERVYERRSPNEKSGLFVVGSLGRGVERFRCLTARLRKEGVLNNKHIPSEYLRASASQRLSLMQGLMDTDGYVSKAGQCEFTTTSAALRDGFLDLARSLGYKPTLKTDRATLDGRDCGEKYRIQFWAFSDAPVFRLSRKIARLRDRLSKQQRSSTLHITSVEEVDSVPVRCIQVSSGSGLFLCGDGMVPTHNSTLCAGLSLYLLTYDNEPGAEVYSAAYTREQAGIVYREASAMVRASGQLAGRLKVMDSLKRIEYPSREGVYAVLSREAGSAEGLNIHGLIFDELHTQKTRDFYESLVYGGASRAQPLFVYITTAGYDVETICYEEHEAALNIMEDRVIDWSSFGLVYAAPPDADWTREETWRLANPSFGETIDPDDFAEQCRRAQALIRRQNAFKRYRLNIWTQQEEAWLDLCQWQAAAEDFDPAALAGRACWGGLDLSSTRDLTAFVVAFPEGESARLLAWFWLPEDGIVERERRDKVPYREWAERGWLNLTPGNVVDYAEVRDVIERAAADYSLQEVAYDPFNATETALMLQAVGIPMVEHRQGLVSMNEPSKRFETMVLRQQIRHLADPVMDWCVQNVGVWEDNNGNIRPVKPKRNSPKRIDGVVAGIMAVGRAMQPQEEKPRPRILAL